MALSPPYVQVADRWTVVRNVVRSLAVVAAAFILAGVLVQFVGFPLLGVESPDALIQDPPLYASLNALSFVGFGLAAVGYLWLRREWSLVAIRRPTARDLALAVGGVFAILAAAMVMGVVVQAIASVVETLFGVTVEQGQNAVITEGRKNPVVFLWMVPVALFFVGPAEELLFRGVVQGLLKQSLGLVPGLLAASGLFGIGHYLAISSGSAWTYLLVAGGLGVVLGVLYEYTENIVVPALTHGLWNAGLFVLNYYLAISGVQLPT